MTLQDKRVLIIGGTSGIGFAVAEAAAAEGAAVVVVSSNKERVDAAVEKLPAGTTGGVLDASDEDAVREFFDGAGALDHIVFTAGDPLQSKRFDTTNVAEARQFFEVRFWVPTPRPATARAACGRAARSC